MKGYGFFKNSSILALWFLFFNIFLHMGAISSSFFTIMLTKIYSRYLPFITNFLRFLERVNFSIQQPYNDTILLFCFVLFYIYQITPNLLTHTSYPLPLGQHHCRNIAYLYYVSINSFI